MSWILNNWQSILTTILAIIGGASALVAAIAPLTKSDVDNKVLNALRWLQDKLGLLALNPRPAAPTSLPLNK